MRRMVVLTVTAMVVALAIAAGACGGGSSAPSAPTPVVRPLADGEVLGKVDRTASGGSGDIVTLVGVSCDHGKLIVRMGSRTVTGEMDCKDLPPQALVERALSKQVTVTYAGGKVRIETVNGEVVEVAATDVVVTETGVTPAG